MQLQHAPDFMPAPEARNLLFLLLGFELGGFNPIYGSILSVTEGLKLMTASTLFKY